MPLAPVEPQRLSLGKKTLVHLAGVPVDQGTLVRGDRHGDTVFRAASADALIVGLGLLVVTLRKFPKAFLFRGRLP